MTYIIKVFKWKKPPNVYRSNLIPPSAISKSNVLQRQCMILDKIAGLQEKLLFFSYFFTQNSLYNTIVDNIQIQPSLKAELAFFFPHVSRAQRLAPARTRNRVVRLGAQCTDHWTTGQSRGVGVPAVQLTTHVKSSTLYGRSYGRTSKFFRLDGLLLFCIITGLRSAISAIIKQNNQR